MLERIGRYRVERMLGTGAFATVWLATDELLDATVAIKVLAENWSHDDDIRRRFTEEARILWRLDSEHVVRVHTVDHMDDGRPYFVMDHADAGNLEARMRARKDESRPYTVDEAVSMSMAIADGLAAAHRQGVVHRDLKPSNVLFRTGSTGERVLLADFGIARSLEAARGPTTISAGTPHYMAPEQSQGRAMRASDIYAAAVVLHELLVGAPPFPYDSAGQVIRAQLTETPADVRIARPEVPAPIAELVARGLSLEPEERPADGDAWKAALGEAASAPVVVARAPTPAAAETVLPLPPQDATLGPGEIAAPSPEGATLGPEDMPAVPTAAPAPSSSGRNRRLLLGAGAGAIVLVVILAVVVGGGGGKKKAKTSRAGSGTLSPTGTAGPDPFTSTTTGGITEVGQPPQAIGDFHLSDSTPTVERFYFSADYLRSTRPPGAFQLSVTGYLQGDDGYRDRRLDSEEKLAKDNFFGDGGIKSETTRDGIRYVCVSGLSEKRRNPSNDVECVWGFHDRIYQVYMLEQTDPQVILAMARTIHEATGA